MDQNEKLSTSGGDSPKSQRRATNQNDELEIPLLIQEYSHVSLDWGDSDIDKIEENPPEALYPAIGDAIRAGLASESLCRSFCGGQGCKYCCPVGRFPIDCFAIEGLYSHWVTPEILAMSRPSDEAIKKYNIVQQLKDRNIRSVFCVQEPREHAHCGLGLVGAYSYDQTELMSHGISVYNLHWADFTCPEFYRMLDLVRVMQFALMEGRIAVHCHAGLGRTGLAIACLLVFVRRLSPALAIAYLRLKRPGSVQSHAQVAGVTEFAERIRPLLVLWPSKSLAAYGHRFSYEEHLWRQRALLHGEASRRLRRLSQLVHTVCARLLQLASGADRDRILGAALAETSGAASPTAPPRLDSEQRGWRDRLNSEGSYRPVLDCQDPGKLFAFLLCWLWELKAPAVTGQHVSLLLSSPTITSGLGRLSAFTAALLRFCAVFVLRFCQPSRHAMDELEEAIVLRLLSALTHSCLPEQRHSPFVKYFASFLDFVECLMEQPGVGAHRAWAAPLGRLCGLPRQVEEEDEELEAAQAAAEAGLANGEALALDAD